MGRINFYSEGISFDLKDKRLYRQWMIATAAEYGFNVGEISVVFVSDDHLLEMNRNYLQHDYYTDIITFDYTEHNSGSDNSPLTNEGAEMVNKGTIGGDLFISYDRVKDNASKNKLSLQNEIQRVVIHGVLHLCGLKDKEKTEVEIMRKAEEKALLNFPEKAKK
jgi:rRNA maturation RNase YbeY